MRIMYERFGGKIKVRVVDGEKVMEYEDSDMDRCMRWVRDVITGKKSAGKSQL